MMQGKAEGVPIKWGSQYYIWVRGDDNIKAGGFFSEKYAINSAQPDAPGLQFSLSLAHSSHTNILVTTEPLGLQLCVSSSRSPELTT